MTGAIILAAGVSSRMGEFKPLLKIGDTTFIRRLIGQMEEAGAEKIVVVTGYRGEELRQHISVGRDHEKHIITLHNRDFYKTQMLDSVKMGISFLKNDCERILLSPVDVVMSPKWIFDAVLNEDADFVRPMYQGEPGHPVLIRHTLYEEILVYEGDRGLRGAVENSGKKILEIDTEDPSILLDADTKDDYQKALHEYDVRKGEHGKLHALIDVSLAYQAPFCDDNFIKMLELVDITGSLQNAASAMKLSYTTTWKKLNSVEKAISEPLIIRTSGGENGGGSELTEKGRELLLRYKKMKEELRLTGDEIFSKYFDDFRL